jgi:hypothetical protein
MAHKAHYDSKDVSLEEADHQYHEKHCKIAIYKEGYSCWQVYSFWIVQKKIRLSTPAHAIVIFLKAKVS